MMYRAKLIVAATILSLIISLPAAAAANPLQRSCTVGDNGSEVCTNIGSQTLFGPHSIWNNLINGFIFVIGAIAVIFIIIGGIRYIASQGDSGAVTQAKNTILYAVVGLIVAIMSYAIVNFVIAAT